MDWRRLGVKPSSKPMMVSLLTHICVTRPQWVEYMHNWPKTDLHHFYIPEVVFQVRASKFSPFGTFTPLLSIRITRPPYLLTSTRLRSTGGVTEHAAEHDCACLKGALTHRERQIIGPFAWEVLTHTNVLKWRVFSNSRICIFDECLIFCLDEYAGL